MVTLSPSILNSVRKERDFGSSETGVDSAGVTTSGKRFKRGRRVARNMEIEFVWCGRLRDAVGEKSLTREVTPGATVGDALSALADEYDDLGPLLFNSRGELRPNVNVLVDEENVRLGSGLDTSLSAGDTVALAPGLSGGRMVSRDSEPEGAA
jgi:molybdopterin synthase sulfur carrier subunit